MPSRSYNQFSPWVQWDDFLTNGANFIEHKNINGLEDGYGVRLWARVNKWFTTWTEQIISMFLDEKSDGSVTSSYAWGTNGVIYRLDATDDTPTYTLTNGWNIVQIVDLPWQLYFFYKLDLAFTTTSVAKISKSDADADNWAAGMDEIYKVGSFSTEAIPPILTVGDLLFIWVNSRVATMNSSGTIVEYNFPDSSVVWITLQGSTIVVSCSSGNVYYWDGASTSESARTYVGSRLNSVWQKGNMDYTFSEDGQLILGSGQQFIRATKPKRSNRMDDGTSYDTRLKFGDASNGIQNRVIVPALDDMYLYANDTTPWIYKYGKLIPWMQDGLHKIITQNNAWAQLDTVYDIWFYERSLGRLFISYKAGSTYWIDYIDVESLETCTDGYFITDVFSGWTNIKKKVIWMQMTNSNTSWDNSISLYYRVDNGSWELIRTYNEATDVITQDDIATVRGTPFKQFIDIQFKVVLHNDTWAEDAPTVHDLTLFYDITE